MRLFTCSLLWATCVFGQDVRTSVLTGKVTDPSAAAVPNAAVKLFNRDNSLRWNAQTTTEGAFRFEQLPPGQYWLEARTDGLDQANPVAVSLKGGEELKVELKLEVKSLSSQVMVTAVATPQSAMEAGKAMDVVDGTELSQRNLITFTESVRMLPGVRVQQLGGPGSFTRVQIRGLRAADSGVLVDGMRLRDVASVQGDATAFMGDLLLMDTDRIEVLRGLGSSLYGTNATAGVINLVTDQGGGVLRGEVSAEGGGLGLFRSLARVAGGALKDKLQYSAGVAFLGVWGGVDGVENVRNTSGQGYLLWRPLPSASLSGRFWGTSSTIGVTYYPYSAPEQNLPATGVIPAIPLAPSQVARGDQGLPFLWGNATFAPNFYDPDSTRYGQFFSTLVSWNQQVSPRWSYRVNYQAAPSSRDNVNGPLGPGYQPFYESSSRFAGRLDTVQGRADVMLARWNLLSAGYEWEREFYENPSSDQNPDPAQRVAARASAAQRSNSIFVQDQMRMMNDRLQVALSGRFQAFGLSQPVFEGGAPQYAGASFNAPPDAYTGDIAVSYFVPRSSSKLRAHAGNGFRAPTLYERLGTSFFFGEFSPLGDPRLRPERTVSFDFGFDQYFGNSKYRVGATYFYTRLQEVIGYADLTNDPYGRWGGYVNTGGGLARGVEVEVQARPWRKTMISGSYTYTNADERYSSLVGGMLQAIRVFPNMFAAVVTQEITQRIQVSVSSLIASDYISGSFFTGSGNRPYQFPGPRRLDVTGSYTLPLGEQRSLRFFARVENVLNQRYFEDGFRTPQAWAVGGMKFYF
jgi:vitamin B12 transporter